MRTPSDRARTWLRRTAGPALLAMLAAGCGGDSAPAPSAPSKDFKSAAKASIDEKNMDSELRKLESEIDADGK